MGEHFNITQLLRPAAFPHDVSPIELRETNLSWVILTGEYAYKVKKRVRLDFLDATRLERRLELCREELRLNHRFAPDLYLGVVPITADRDGPRIDGSGPIVEYAVRMRQFDPASEMSTLLERGEITSPELLRLADDLARSHSLSPSAAPGGDSINTINFRDAVGNTLTTLRAHPGGTDMLRNFEPLCGWLSAMLYREAARLQGREHDGYVRECHGDLHAGNVVRWRERLTAFDALEFDPRLRWIDVLNDLAFLVMDLVARGHSALAAVFLNRYLEDTGDYPGVPLLRLYAVYRALIRAMVDGLAVESNPQRREEFRRRLAARVAAARALADPPRPLLLLMHGFSGSGKSWLSERLIAPLAAIRIRSDVERRRLGERFSCTNPHAPDFDTRTYERLYDCARSCLEGGYSAIVDASFLAGRDRRHFQGLADLCGVNGVILSCEADYSVLARRIAERLRSGADVSDADLAVLDRQLRVAEPLQAGELANGVRVDTSTGDPPREALAGIARIVRLGRPRRP